MSLKSPTMLSAISNPSGCGAVILWPLISPVSERTSSHEQYGFVSATKLNDTAGQEFCCPLLNNRQAAASVCPVMSNFSTPSARAVGPTICNANKARVEITVMRIVGGHLNPLVSRPQGLTLGESKGVRP